MTKKIWSIIVDSYWRKIPPTIFLNKEKEINLIKE